MNSLLKTAQLEGLFIILSVISIVIIFKTIRGLKKSNYGKTMKLEYDKYRDDLYKLERRDLVQRKKINRILSEKGLKKYFFKDGTYQWGNDEIITEWRKIESDFDNNYQSLTPYEFEDLIKDLFIKMGFTASTTSRTGDYGADIILEKEGIRTVVQVKQYSKYNRIGAVEIQQLLGSMWKYNADKAIYVTTSSFTKQAYNQSSNAPIELWDGKILYDKMITYYFTVETNKTDEEKFEVDAQHLKYLPIFESFLSSKYSLVKVEIPGKSSTNLYNELIESLTRYNLGEIITVEQKDCVVYLEKAGVPLLTNKKCPLCGSENPPFSVNCSICGTLLKNG